MRSNDGQPPHEDPLAYLITWGTYGTWLPADERGWIEYRHGWHLPDPVRKLEASSRMAEDVRLLNHCQREAVNRQIEETCAHRGWELYAVNCRSNHVHVVVAAAEKPKRMRSQIKAWCTRRLKELAIAVGDPPLENW